MHTDNKGNTAIIILAAGDSTRLGRPKQLLKFNGKTLLQHTIDEALEANTGPVILVLGNIFSEFVRDDNAKIDIVANPRWHEGMSTSIHFGLKQAIKYESTENVLITVADQPFISASIFRELEVQNIRYGASIAASNYCDTVGVPALFNKLYFPDLLSLKGDEGAKKLLNIHQTKLSLVSFEQGAVDIDTESDYIELLKKR